jgi:hypothetical protein
MHTILIQNYRPPQVLFVYAFLNFITDEIRIPISCHFLVILAMFFEYSHLKVDKVGNVAKIHPARTRILSMDGLYVANNLTNRAGHYGFLYLFILVSIEAPFNIVHKRSLFMRMSAVSTTVISISNVISAPCTECTDMSSTTATRSANQTKMSAAINRDPVCRSTKRINVL